MDSHDGIQQLLVAEQEAQAIVTAARKAKTERLRLARMEADKEIADYRGQREAHFKQLMQAQTGDAGATAIRLETEANQSIASIGSLVSQSKGEVVQMLLNQVTTVS